MKSQFIEFPGEESASLKMCPAHSQASQWMRCRFNRSLSQMRKHRRIIQPNSAVYTDDASGLINGRKQRGATQTLAVKVKGTGRENQEELGRHSLWI